MTITALGLALYAGALFILFITPGPVWVAVVARTLSGGIRSAWPLALGVATDDIIWPLVAIFGVTWLVSVYSEFLIVLRWIAVAMFIIMGLLVIRHADKEIGTDTRLTRPGMWAGFIAGLVAVTANPKAAIFYMGLLPEFFDFTQLTWLDIAVILPVSAAVPFFGNMLLALFVDKMLQLLKSPQALRRTNYVAGALLIGVGIAIAIT